MYSQDQSSSKNERSTQADYILPLSIKMLQSAPQNAEGISINDNPVVLFSIVGRITNVINGQKLQISITDDTGIMQVTFLQNGNNTQLQINEEDINQAYYKIIIRINKFSKNLIFYGQRMQLIIDSNQICQHLGSIMLSHKIRNNQTSYILTSSFEKQELKSDDKWDDKKEFNLQDKILMFIEGQGENAEVAQQAIYGHLSQNYSITQIRNELEMMKTSAILIEGDKKNSYRKI